MAYRVLWNGALSVTRRCNRCIVARGRVNRILCDGDASLRRCVSLDGWRAAVLARNSGGSGVSMRRLIVSVVRDRQSACVASSNPSILIFPGSNRQH